MSATVLIVIARLGLAALWGLAAFGKLRSPRRWRATLEEIGVPRRLLSPMAVTVPATELVLAAGLLVPATASAAALGSAALLGAFALTVAVALARGRAPECNCFGSARSAPLDRALVGRDLALAALALFVAWSPAFEIAPAALVAVAGVAAALALGGLCFALLRRHGRALARIDALEAGAPTGLRPPPAVGSAAPAFLVRDLAGETISSVDLLAGERSLLLVFVDPDCGPCRRLLPTLARLRSEPGRPRIAVIGAGGADAVRAVAAEAGLAGALVQEEREVATAYGIAGTPAAVLVSARGVVAAGPALGADAVEALLAESGEGIEPRRRPSEVVPGLAPPPPAPASPTPGPALATAAAAAALGTALLGASPAAAAEDPGLAAIRAKLEAVAPLIVADLSSFEKTFAKVASSRRRRPPLAKLKGPLAAQRARAVALQGELGAIATASAEAQAVREAAVRSAGFIVQGMDEFERSLGITGEKERKRSAERMHGLFEQARVAAYYANVGLGCTGKEC
ncbi:MAG: redoxin domain-containing protein [Actinobacteria bacterium]|nr:redoxin domain-containing protein [Actinomycetota bacterium]